MGRDVSLSEPTGGEFESVDHLGPQAACSRHLRNRRRCGAVLSSGRDMQHDERMILLECKHVLASEQRRCHTDDGWFGARGVACLAV